MKSSVQSWAEASSGIQTLDLVIRSQEIQLGHLDASELSK